MVIKYAPEFPLKVIMIEWLRSGGMGNYLLKFVDATLYELSFATLYELSPVNRRMRGM